MSVLGISCSGFRGHGLWSRRRWSEGDFRTLWANPFERFLPFIQSWIFLVWGVLSLYPIISLVNAESFLCREFLWSFWSRIIGQGLFQI